MRNKLARDVMTRNVITVSPQARLTEAARKLLDHAISGLPVVEENGRLVGCMTEHDLMNFVFSGDADSTRVREAMSEPVFKFAPDAELPVIVNCFAENGVRRVPIVEDEKVVGIVSRRDVLREMLTLYE